ncbi:MAG: hypothetical protein ABSH02_03865 [Candidatus Sulfotelmatobacter sp.]|jgi:hypothetical protein
MFPSGTTSLGFDGQACRLRGPGDVVSLRDEGTELLPDFLLLQRAIIPWAVFKSLLRDSAPGILKSDVCDGGLK